jgi:regulatory protein
MTRRRSVAGALGASVTADLPDDIAADPGVDPESAARTICLNLLTSRSRTKAELADALRSRAVPGTAAERVLNRLTEVGLIDDEAFAENFANVRQTERGLAGREIARQLRGRGVSDDVVSRVIADIDGDRELATARRLVARKLPSMRSLDSTTQIRRLVGMLARKGYPPSQAYQVVRDAIDLSAAEQVDDTAWLS